MRRLLFGIWTETHREAYKPSGTGLPSDLTDAQWKRLEPLIPAAKPGGRSRKTDMRLAMKAIFYLLRAGCPWRYLPRGPFPPRSMVCNIFVAFQRERVWDGIWDVRRVALRELAGRKASPTAAVIDSQSLKAAEKGGASSRGEEDAVGYDAGRKVKGRKLHALVDVSGLPLRVLVHSAAIQDRDGAALGLARFFTAFLGWSSFGPTAATTRIRSRTPRPSARAYASRSSSDPMT